MENKSKIVFLVALVLLVITPAATAIQAPPYAVDSGVSKTVSGTYYPAERKDTWRYMSGYDNELMYNMAIWITIPPGTDMSWHPEGQSRLYTCNQHTSGCVGSYDYRVQWRLFTPDGTDWLKNYGSALRKNGGMYNTAQGKVYLSEPEDFRKSATTTIPAGDLGGDLGGPVIHVEDLRDIGLTAPYEWLGQWKAEIWIYDWQADSSYLASTQYFTLVDGTQTVTKPIMSSNNYPVSVTTTTPTPTQTTSKNIPLSVTTTPTPAPASQTQRIVIEAERYSNANVKKTGTSWDSTVENCPNWRSSDWSGTGDYYLSQGGDSLTYSFTAPKKGTYTLWMRDWSDPNHAAGDRQVTILIDSGMIGTFDAANAFNRGTTGYGWDKLTSVDLASGSHTMTITKKDSTSSAAILDALWFSSSPGDTPQGPAMHSEDLCTGKTTTQVSYVPWTQESPTLPSGIEIAVIPLAIGIAACFFMKRRD